MTGNEIPDNDNVVRYVGATNIGENGYALGGAFRLRAGEDRLSVNWLECFSGMSKLEQLSEIRKLSRLDMGRNGRLAELNVGSTKEHIHHKLPLIRFVKSPLPATENCVADPSHADIIGPPTMSSPQSALIGDMIAECVNGLHPAREN